MLHCLQHAEVGFFKELLKIKPGEKGVVFLNDAYYKRKVELEEMRIYAFIAGFEPFDQSLFMYVGMELFRRA